jgi:hypothetical protein
MNQEIDNLETQTLADAVATFGGALLQLIPVVGPLLAEILKVTIPNQRLDRVVDFLRILQQEMDVAKLSLEQVRKGHEILIEDGILIALRTNSRAHYRRASKVIVEGLTTNVDGLAEERFLLSLLGELTDAEIVWLGSTISRDVQEQHAYHEAHRMELSKSSTHIASSVGAKESSAVVDGYHSHLERLGLIRPIYNMEGKRQGFVGDGSYRDVNLKAKKYKATHLGELLFRKIADSG